MHGEECVKLTYSNYLNCNVLLLYISFNFPFNNHFDVNIAIIYITSAYLHIISILVQASVVLITNQKALLQAYYRSHENEKI